MLSRIEALYICCLIQRHFAGCWLVCPLISVSFAGPGMVVVCIARSLNGVGYSEWSDRQPKVGKDAPNITNPDVPTTPEAPRFDQSSTTPHGGDFTFRVGRCNGMLYSQFHYRLYAGMIGADWDELSCVPGWGVEAPWKDWRKWCANHELCKSLERNWGTSIIHAWSCLSSPSFSFQ